MSPIRWPNELLTDANRGGHHARLNRELAHPSRNSSRPSLEGNRLDREAQRPAPARSAVNAGQDRRESRAGPTGGARFSAGCYTGCRPDSTEPIPVALTGLNEVPAVQISAWLKRGSSILGRWSRPSTRAAISTP